ncbi:CHAT domain-containing protein [Dactylosporangium sp. CS-033363]|uniref:CHAT domain-containing protein n=1 Tax=Dactylosporangium sp. CS-033363 TaxID=3239935 RepID=UPI003D8BC420
MTGTHRHQADFHDEYDGANRLHDPVQPCPGNRRTLRIRYVPAGDGFDVIVTGVADDSPAGPIAHLAADADDIRFWVNDLLRAWSTWLIDWPDPDGLDEYPFADRVDHRDLDPRTLRAMWQRLAQAGHELFQNLFQGNAALEALGTAVARALHARPQVITVVADEVIVPWPMLYVPADPWADLPGDFDVDLDTFVGHRHLVEHAFARHGANPSSIRLDGRVAAGAYYDTRLHLAANPTLGAAMDALALHTRLVRTTSADELTERMRADGAADHLVYFCCHCVTRPGEELLRFSRDVGDEISAGNLGNRLRRKFQRFPLVLLNACQAGKVERVSLRQFGPVLFERGAGAVIGPVVNIPTVFAGEFARQFFERVLPHRGLLHFSTVARELVQGFARDQRNLLALTYMLYQGIDGHFCRREQDAGPTAGR